MNFHFSLLALLANGPRTGLRLGQELAAGWTGLPAASADRVDAALSQLARAGLVAAEADAVGQLRITASGRRELAGWLRRTPEPADGDELVLKITLAGQVPGTDVHEVIQVHRRYLIESMQRRVRAGPGQCQRQDGQSLGLTLAWAAELSRLDAVVRWLATADSLVGWVSDADRDLAIARLREHFAVGRLTHPELDERLAAALTAQTAADLRGLLADLP
jgi:DNA-binding PadR family transcriptional regulator